MPSNITKKNIEEMKKKYKKSAFEKPKKNATP